MVGVLAVLGLIVVGVGFYLYFFLKRALDTFGADTKNKWIKTAVILTAVFLAALTAYPMGFAMVIVLHIVAFAFFVQLINFVLKKTVGRRYAMTFWKKLYGSGIIPIFLTIVILFGGYVNLHNVVQTRYTVYTDKDIREEGYRVALIADVHFGVSLDSEELLEKCAQISEQTPDIVILGGDMVDNATTKAQMKAVFAALGTIESELGIYYVHGNHDRPMSIINSEYTEEELVQTILENGITILQDDVLPLTDDLTIVGREDRSVPKRKSLSELFENMDQTDFILTLDHQPNQYKENGKLGTDLLLSGHTHGGQLFPINYVQALIPFNDGVYGRYDIDADTVAIVTSGFATWNYPSKTAAPAEYVIIDIVEE